MMAGMQGRRVLITGATSGIGWAMAKAFAGAGAHLMLNGLEDVATMNIRCTELATTTGVQVHFNPADLSDQAQVEALCADSLSRLGGVDILLNNAGALNTPQASVENVNPAKWDFLMAVNVTAAFHTIRLLLPGMKERGWGRIINTASAAGLIALPNSVPYIASKHAIVGLTKAVGLELARTRITCNAICPALIETEFVHDRLVTAAEKRGVSLEEITERALRERQPSGRLIPMEDIVAFALFLASDGAGSINGAALPIDHAWTAM
jgi:3-hydroxybutyrate dehydrogenase